MATKTLSPQENLASENKLAGTQANLESTLQKSPTAYAANTNPTSYDLSTDVKLRDIQAQRDKLESQRIADKWYGPNKPEDQIVAGKDEGGLIGRALGAISKPLYGMVGAAEWALGKGTKTGILQNIDDNMFNRKETFGNLIQKYGAPLAVSAPIGFALDIAFDPVNWATAGTTALIPRVGYGLAKAGVEGATEGLRSGILQKAAAIGKYVPGVKGGEGLANLGEKAITSYDKFNALTGRSVESILDKNAARVTGGDMLANTIGRLPHGDKILEAFAYNPSKWQKAQELQDALMVKQQGLGRMLETKPNFEGQMVGPSSKESALTLSSMEPEPIHGISPVKNATPTDDLAGHMGQLKDDGVKIAEENPHWVRADAETNGERLEGEYMNDQRTKNLSGFHSAIEELRAGGTGVESFDKGIEKIRDFKIGNVEVGKNTLDALSVFDGIFKRMKVGGSPSTWMNAILGNPTMAGMWGINITNKAYRKTIAKTAQYLTGMGDGEFVGRMLFDENWSKYMFDSPETFRKTYGFSPASGGMSQIVRNTIKNSPDLLEKFGGDLKMAESEMTKVLKTELDSFKSEFAQKSGYDFMNPKVKPGDVGTSFASNDLYSDAFYNFKKGLETKGTQGNVFAKALLWTLEKPVQGYEKIDQTYKLATALHIANNGITEKELLVGSKSTRIAASDILSKFKQDGQYMYRLTPKKATEIANEIFMNYNAMPAAVKVLRSLPIIGAPFVSFTYAMTHKVAKGMAYNPSFFNKVNFLMNELQGRAGPLEKKGLENKYYSWYTQPGMMRLPFFQENPIYLNLANMLPYYSMNMFMPSERKYADTLPSVVASVVDKSPFMKTPVGQTIFDYFIQPMMIRDSNPQGQFGNPLYPTDATGLEKTGYAARSLAEAVVPGAASMAGLANLGGWMPQEAIQATPSYRFRQLAEAVEGKTPIGTIGKEAPASRTIRALLSNFGIQLHPMDLTFLSSEVKKNTKK